MRVHVGVAVAGEVLRASDDSGGLGSSDERGRVSRHQSAVGAERPDPDHRIRRIDVDVRDRSEIEVHADIHEIPRDRGGDLLGQVDVVHRAERRVARIRASGRTLEARDVAAFLVDRDENIATRLPKRGGQRAKLVSTLDVAREEHDSAEALVQPARDPRRRLESGKTREETDARQPLEVVCHPLTEPAVNPNAIFRCTSRKKTTTGIAVSVDAAMSAPQSVFRLVPEKYESQTVSV